MVQAGGVKLADHISLKLNLTHTYSLDAVKALQNVMSGGAWDKAIDYDQKVASFQEGRAIFQPGEYWFVMASNRWPANLWGEVIQNMVMFLSQDRITLPLQKHISTVLVILFI